MNAVLDRQGTSEVLPLTVLIIDTDASLEPVRDALALLGHTVLVRTTTRALAVGLTVLDPQVLVMDPDGPRMRQVAAFVRQHFPHIYIVAYTSKLLPYLRPLPCFDVALPRGPLPTFSARFERWASNL
jgi:hypothetical protein